MKNINALLQKIEEFTTLAEKELVKLAAEHAVERAMERGNDPRLAQLATDDILNKMYAIQKNKKIFDRIPLQSKWTLNSFNGNKAVVQKIWEEGHLKLILKTFLEEGMRETNIEGSLEDFIRTVANESIALEIADKKKTIKALEKLLEKKLPMSAQQLKNNCAPEYWKKILGIIPFLKNGIITKEVVDVYKRMVEQDLSKTMDSLLK